MRFRAGGFQEQELYHPNGRRIAVNADLAVEFVDPSSGLRNGVAILRRIALAKPLPPVTVPHSRRIYA
jgi:hypothetical protein